MAFTKVLPAGISSSFNLTVDSINSVGVVTATGIVASTGTFSGNVSIAGTLTYEDVSNIDSVGIITAQSGIHVTGGNIGVNNTNPQSQLHVTNASASTISLMEDGASGADLVYDGSTNYFSIKTGTGGAGSQTTRLTIQRDNGNLGIGTDNPQHNLHLYNNGDATLFIQADADNVDEDHNPKISMSQDGQTSSIFDIGINGSAGDAFTDALANTAYLYSVSNATSNGIQFATNGAARMYLNNNGRLGIGSQAPGDPLDIADNDPAIRLTDINGEVYHRIRSSSQDLLIECDDGAAGAKPNLRFQVGNEEKFRVTGVGGSFGIGTNDPQARLHVNTTIDDDNETQWAFHLTQDDPLNAINQLGGSGIGILFKTATNSVPAIGAGIAAQKPGTSDSDTTTDLVFYTSQNDETLDEAVRITSDGYFRVTAQPAALVYKTGTTQSISANVIYAYDATGINQGGMTISGSRDRITVPVAGKYMISAAASGSVTTANAGDGWRLRLLRDGSVYGDTYLYPIETTGSSVGQEFSLQFSIVANAGADDYFEVQIENVGSARADMSYGYFSVYLLG